MLRRRDTERRRHCTFIYFMAFRMKNVENGLAFGYNGLELMMEALEFAANRTKDDHGSI